MRIKMRILCGVLSLLFLLAGCKMTKQYELLQPVERVRSVELGTLDVGEITFFSINPKTEIQIIAELDDFSILNEIQELPCGTYWNDPCQTMSGYIIVVTYQDGAIQYISRDCSAVDVNGKKKYIRDYFALEYDALVESYLAS